MVNLSLNKNEAGVVTLTLEYHESTQMELLFDFIRTQASNAYVPAAPLATTQVPTSSTLSHVSPQPTPQQESSVASTPTGSTEPKAPQAPIAQVAKTEAPNPVTHAGVSPTAAPTETAVAQADKATSLDDLSDNEAATLVALAQLAAPLVEAKDILPLLYSGGRFKSRSDDHASIVRYLLRTLIAKGLLEETEAGRELTQLGSLLAASALQASRPSAAPAPYRWSPES